MRLLALVTALTVVSWDATALDCHGAQLLSPIDHYDLTAFAAFIVGWELDVNGDQVPIYPRALGLRTAATLVDMTPEPGDVIGWDGMWDEVWRIQPPPVEAFTQAGIGSNAPCD